MRMEKIIAPSMMCAGFLGLDRVLELFAHERVGLLHLDIMDGHFVSNITLGTDYVAEMKKATAIPLDLHLMVEEPEKMLDCFAFGEGDRVSVHAESTRHLQKCLAAIRERGAHPTVALNPATPLAVLDYVLEDLDGVLVMTVNPGFGGQKSVPSALRKIADVRAYLDSHRKQDASVEADGNVSFENTVKMARAGADIFVAGTSSLFAKNGKSLRENLHEMSRCIEAGERQTANCV